jgi:hypothetical protein
VDDPDNTNVQTEGFRTQPRGEQAMTKKRKPLDERTAEDSREAADNTLELARVLAGQGRMSDQEFLERMARSDELVYDDGETSGMSYNILLGAQVAREMLEAGEYEDFVSKWANEARRRWEEGKFFKLWQEEKTAGRDPNKAFEERGWEP